MSCTSSVSCRPFLDARRVPGFGGVHTQGDGVQQCVARRRDLKDAHVLERGNRRVNIRIDPGRHQLRLADAVGLAACSHINRIAHGWKFAVGTGPAVPRPGHVENLLETESIGPAIRGRHGDFQDPCPILISIKNNMLRHLDTLFGAVFVNVGTQKCTPGVHREIRPRRPSWPTWHIYAIGV